MDLNSSTQEAMTLRTEKCFGAILISKQLIYSRNSEMYKFIQAINKARKQANAGA